MTKAILLALLLSLSACDLNADADVHDNSLSVYFVVDDICALLNPEEEEGSPRPDIPLPRYEGEPCNAETGERCDEGLVCLCWVCIALL